MLLFKKNIYIFHCQSNFISTFNIETYSDQTGADAQKRQHLLFLSVFLNQHTKNSVVFFSFRMKRSHFVIELFLCFIVIWQSDWTEAVRRRFFFFGIVNDKIRRKKTNNTTKPNKQGIASKLENKRQVIGLSLFG